MNRFFEYLKRGLNFVLKGQPIEHITPRIVSLQKNELLIGRTALITGGTSGIGKAIAMSFINAGANVIITSRTQEKADLIANSFELKHKGQFAKGFELNNEAIESFNDTFKRILDDIKGIKIDILVNNAGIRGGRWGNTSIQEYDKVMNTNLKGVFFFTEIVSRYMVNNKIHGNILNICSASSLRPANSAYCLSKWGMRAFTEGLAKTLIPYDIVVNGIAPGPTATPMFGLNTGDNIAASGQPNKRFTTVEEIADMAVVYVSDMARTIVGDIAYMTGGAANLTLDDNNYNL